MSVVQISIDTSNAAFDGQEEQEVAHILDQLAKRIAQTSVEDVAYNASNLRDSNGNTVGKLEVL